MRTDRLGGGDLAKMIGFPDGLIERQVMLEARSPRRAKLTVNDTWGVGLTTEIQDDRLPKACIFRDSFCTHLIPFLSEHFKTAHYVWRYDFDKVMLEREKPDIVILEVAERLVLNIP